MTTPIAGCRYAHTNIVATDADALASFYIDVFGCTLVPPARALDGDWLARGTGVADARLRGVHLRLPGHGEQGPTLEIFTYTRDLPDEGAREANRRGLRHLAFAVDDVRGAVDAVVAAGGSLVGEIVARDIPGAGRVTFVYVADPEDNLIELQRWSPGSRTRSRTSAASARAVAAVRLAADRDGVVAVEVAASEEAEGATEGSTRVGAVCVRGALLVAEPVTCLAARNARVGRSQAARLVLVQEVAGGAWRCGESGKRVARFAGRVVATREERDPEQDGGERPTDERTRGRSHG